VDKLIAFAISCFQIIGTNPLNNVFFF